MPALCGNRIAPEMLQQLATMSGLERLRFEDPSDEDLAKVSHMTQLRALEVWGDRITDAGIDHKRQPAGKVLTVFGW